MERGMDNWTDPQRIRWMDYARIFAPTDRPRIVCQVKEMALKSEGCFALLNQPAVRSESPDARISGNSGSSVKSVEFVRWRDIMNDEMMVECVKWAELKNPARAAEKASRVYSQDVSCLLDICRQSIM